MVMCSHATSSSPACCQQAKQNQAGKILMITCKLVKAIHWCASSDPVCKTETSSDSWQCGMVQHCKRWSNDNNSNSLQPNSSSHQALDELPLCSCLWGCLSTLVLDKTHKLTFTELLKSSLLGCLQDLWVHEALNDFTLSLRSLQSFTSLELPSCQLSWMLLHLRGLNC